MRNTTKTILALIAAINLLSPAYLWGKGEDSDWKAAQKKGDLKSYDLFLKDYPDSSRADQAKAEAVELSRKNIQKAAKNCGALFPRMLYYVTAEGETILVSESDLAQYLADAANCPYEKTLNIEEKTRAVDGLLFARSRLELLPESKLPPKAIIDLDSILINLEEAIIRDVFKNIVRCHDQSAWVDTPREKALKCARPYRKQQMRLAGAIGSQAKSDFDRISRVNDRQYRIEFWTGYQKMAKNDVIEEIAMAYQLHTEALKAKQQETDPAVAAEIEKAAIKLGGRGKPMGGYSSR